MSYPFLVVRTVIDPLEPWFRPWRIALDLWWEVLLPPWWFGLVRLDLRCHWNLWSSFLLRIMKEFNGIIPSHIMLCTSGSTSLGMLLIIVKVFISKVTLVPTLSFALSNLAFTPTTYLGPPDDFTITSKLNEVSNSIGLQCSSFNCFKTSPMICPTD